MMRGRFIERTARATGDVVGNVDECGQNGDVRCGIDHAQPPRLDPERELKRRQPRRQIRDERLPHRVGHRVRGTEAGRLYATRSGLGTRTGGG